MGSGVENSVPLTWFRELKSEETPHCLAEREHQ